MPTGRFNISNITQEFSVQVNDIIGRGNNANPYLHVPLSINFVPYRPNAKSDYSSFVLMQIYAELSLTQQNCQVSQVSVPLQYPVHGPTSYLTTLRFPLTYEKVDFIERCRDGNLAASLIFNLQVAHHFQLPTADPKANYSASVIRDFELAHGHSQFTIERSHWIDKILPGLGYTPGALIEVPPVSVLLPEEYAKSIKELEEARRYFTANDYDKTVGHCRSAIDPLHDQFCRIKDPSRGAPSSLFKWLNENLTATYNYIEATLAANYRIANKSHHPPSSGNFDRAQAETILGTTTYLLSYFGKVTPEIIQKKAT